MLTLLPESWVLGPCLCVGTALAEMSVGRMSEPPGGRQMWLVSFSKLLLCSAHLAMLLPLVSFALAVSLCP